MRSARLGNIADIERSSVTPADIQQGETYVGLEHITTDGRFVAVAQVDAGELQSNKFRFGPEHILYGKLRPYLSKIARPTFHGVCSTDILPIRPGPEVDRSYLTHVLRTPEMVAEATRLSQGANLPRLSPSALAEFEIPLPPLEEQWRIASILDAADALRTKRRQTLEQLDSLTQSIFIDMFGSLNKRVVLSDLLSDAELFTDGDWVESKDQDPEGGVRLTQLADVGVGQWINKSRRFMTPERAKALNCTYLQAGDVLVARMPDPIGRACLFPGDPMPAVTAVDVCIIRPDQQKLSARWLVEALNLPSTRRQAEALAVGATRQRVSRGNLGRVAVPEVELPEQRLFAERADRIDDLRLRSAAALAETERLFASLQHRAFRGEL
jgi:type I restriction enzyme S subunit